MTAKDRKVAVVSLRSAAAATGRGNQRVYLAPQATRILTAVSEPGLTGDLVAWYFFCTPEVGAMLMSLLAEATECGDIP